MTDHLSNALRSYLESADITAVSLEEKAALPSATISRIFTGRHPRSATMSAILGAVPLTEAQKLLRAYLLDDCPVNWQQQLRIDIDDSHDPRPITGIDDLTRALSGLQKLAAGDADLRQWLIDTARLMQAQ